MNKIFIAALVTTAIASGGALAQSATNSATTNSSTNPPAIATQGVDSQTSAAPVPGATASPKRRPARVWRPTATRPSPS